MSEALVKLTHEATDIHQSIITQLNNVEKDPLRSANLLRGFITAFEPQPLLLDPHLASYVHMLCATFELAHTLLSSTNEVIEATGAILVSFANVRGYQAMIPYFNADVYKLEELVDYVISMPSPNNLVLPLMWICNLVMVPFSLSTSKENTLIKLYHASITIINNATPGLAIQKIILIMMARLLRRSDAMASLLPQYLSYLVEEWQSFRPNTVVGHYMVMHQVLKESVSADLCLIVSSIIKVDIEKAHSNLFQLYRTRILAQLAVIYTRQQNFEAVSEITNDLTQILHEVDSFDENSRYAWAKGLASYTQELGKVAKNYQNQLIQHIYSQILSSSLQDTIPVQKLHASLLYFGFLTLANLLPSTWTERIIEVARKYLFFERWFFRSNVGTVVRDALNFILWSISRTAKQSRILTKLLKRAFKDLLQVAVTDSDLMVRRGAVAVIQEMLGRAGPRIFDHVSSNNSGEIVIEIIEELNTLAVLTLTSLYLLIPFLESKGYSFQDVLIEKMQPEVDWHQQRIATGYVIWDDLVLKRIRFDHDNLYCLCQGLLVMGKSEPNESIDIFGELFKFDGESISQAAGYLSWCTLRGKYDLEVITSIVTSVIAHEIRTLMKDMCCRMPKHLLVDLVPLIPLLPAFAEAFFAADLPETIIENVMGMPFDTKVNIDVRVAICSVSPWKPNFINLLDDYTTTFQGEVGQKLRVAILTRLENDKIPISDSIRGRLLRLAGEPIDSVAKCAKRLLQTNDLWEMYPKMDAESKLEFWRGMAMSIGGQSVASETVNDNLKKFFDLYRSEFQLDILHYLMKLETFCFEPPNRIVSALTTWRRLLEAQLPIPETFDWRNLLKQVYNLHINTREWMRVEAAIRLFGRLYFVKDEGVRSTVVERLIFLLHHRQPRIRACANDTVANILTIIGGAVSILDEIDQSTPLARQAEDIRHALDLCNS